MVREPLIGSQAMAPSKTSASHAHAEPGFWARLAQLGTNIDPGELRQLALGLVFFRHISEAFAERRHQLERETRNPRSLYFCLHQEQRRAMLERPAAYLSVKVLWVPPPARWERIREAVGRPTLGRTIDAAVISLERDNPRLGGLFPRDYARPELREALSALVQTVDALGVAGDSSEPSLTQLSEDFTGGHRSSLAVVPPPAADREPFSGLLNRLDDQLKALDHQLQQSQAFRARNGGT